jgi:oxaloacetate decarboxylase gamma subunit
VDETELFGRGVELMLVGMGTVFTFLTLLVSATTLMSVTVRRFFPESVESAAEGTPAAPAEEGELLAVVSAAVTAYRGRGNGS